MSGVSRDDVVRFGMTAALAAGHDPWKVRQWTRGDLVHFAQYTLLTGL